MSEPGDDFELRMPEHRHAGQRPGWFKAAYDDFCRKCRVAIYAGEWAMMTDDGIICNDCGSEEEAD